MDINAKKDGYVNLQIELGERRDELYVSPVHVVDEAVADREQVQSFCNYQVK